MSDLKLNQSQVGQFLKCPEQWRRVNVEGERIPPPFSMLRGTAVHAGAELNFTQKIASGVDLPRNQVVEAAVESLQSTVRKEGVLLDAEETTRGLAVVQNEVEKKVAQMATVFSLEIAPRYQPTDVELRTEIRISDDLVLHGRVDWIDDQEQVSDLKTGAASGWGGDAVETSIQLTAYAILYYAVKKKLPRRLVIELISDKATPENKTFGTTRDGDDFEAFLANLKAVAFAMRAGAFTGAYGQKGAWWCSKKFCGFWSTCQFVPKSRRG
jgi:hypothetical protein